MTIPCIHKLEDSSLKERHKSITSSLHHTITPSPHHANIQPLLTPLPPLTAHRSPLTTHHSPLTRYVAISLLLSRHNHYKMNPIRFHRFFIFLLSWAIAQEIPDIHPDNINSFPFNKLKTGPEVKSSGKKLIQQPEGWTEISGVEKTSSDTIFVAVHGYGSTGYEWIYPLKKISERGFKTFFYRYDWDLCPDQVASQLAAAINELLFIVPEAKTMIILSHSFGGIITTLLANKLQISIPVEIHTIASPLAGYPGLTDRCEMSELSYPVFRGNMSHYQWRTQHKQDGAFRQLKVDPQLVAIDGSKVILLPEMMDGHRLGHNWSISWVIDHFGLNGDEDN